MKNKDVEYLKDIKSVFDTTNSHEVPGHPELFYKNTDEMVHCENLSGGQTVFTIKEFHKLTFGY